MMIALPLPSGMLIIDGTLWTPLDTAHTLLTIASKGWLSICHLDIAYGAYLYAASTSETIV